MSLPACSTAQYAVAHRQPEKKESPEPIADADVMNRRVLLINGQKKECTLFIRREEVRLRAGNREYVILGATGPYGLPIPVTAAMVRNSEGELMITSEEGMVGISVDIPNVAKGDLTLRDEAVVAFVESLENTTDQEKPTMNVLRGKVRVANMYTMEYDRTPCILRVREVAKE